MRRSESPGGVLLGILSGGGGGGGGVCRPVPQILTRFQTKKSNFPHPFSDVAFRQKLGSLSKYDDDHNDDQNNSSARASCFLVHFFDVLCTTTM